MKNNIPTSITKEEIKKLPLGGFEGEIVLVDDKANIEQYANELSCESVIGFDTETRPAFKKGVRYETSLLQLGTKNRVYLFRLNKMGLHKSLTDIFKNPEILKVGVGIRDDIKELRLMTEFTPASFVELQQTATVAGLESISLQKLAAILLNIRISKAARVSNWEANRLTRVQIKYAATDAWVALELYYKLTKLI